MQRVAVGVPAIAIVGARAAQAHVGDFDILERCVCGHPVDAANDIRPPAGAPVVEHADRVDRNARRDAHDAGAVVDRADGPGDVSAVTVPVAEAVPGLAVLPAGDIEIGMRSAPRVDDGDANRPAGRCDVQSSGLAVDPVDAGGQRLLHRMDVAVFGDERHSGIAANVADPRLRDRRGISLQRAVIERGNIRAVRPAVLCRQAVDIALIIVENDDVAPRGGHRRLTKQLEARPGKNGGNRNHHGDSFHRNPS